jgi:hypothetical protein
MDVFSQVSFRVSPELKDRLAQVTDKRADNYAPTQRQVLTRGLELVLQELEKKRGSSRKSI